MPGSPAPFRADVAVIIALKEEFRVFLECARARARSVAVPNLEFGGEDYHLEIPCDDGSHYTLVTTLVDDMGPGPAGDATHRLLRYQPRVVVSLGIAASLDSKDLRLGDVIVADQGNAYLDKSKAIPNSDSWELDLGGDAFRSPNHIVNAVSKLEFGSPNYERWQMDAATRLHESLADNHRHELIRRRHLRELPQIQRAHLASGPTVGAAAAFGKWLRSKADRNAKALDMESAGVMRAVYSRLTDAVSLVLRGISDLGDADKGQLDKLGDGAMRVYAMCNVTEALMLTLAAGRLPRHDRVKEAEDNVKGDVSSRATTLTTTDTPSHSERSHSANEAGSHEDIGKAVATIIEQLKMRRGLRQGSSEYEKVTALIDERVRLVRDNFQPEEGCTVAGARLTKVISYGNFGTVWEGFDEELGKKVAVKVFRNEALAQGQMLYRFRRSVRTARLLCEPSRQKGHRGKARIVQFHKADPTELAFSMELHERGDLSRIEQSGWDLQHKISFMSALCWAVEYAHKNGVIHRDIKPANILLDSSDLPVLTDFDIADIEFATALSSAVDGGLGTPVFAAPEQISFAEQSPDKRLDVYSLGRVLHFLLLERPPPAPESDPELRELNGMPVALIEVVRRATQKTPHDRFVDVSSMRNALEQYQDHRVTITTGVIRAGRMLGRNWQALAISSLVGAGILAALVVQADRRDRTVEANAAKLRAEETQLQIEELAGNLAESQAREAKLLESKEMLEQGLAAEQKELTMLPDGSDEYLDLSQKIDADEASLAEVNASLTKEKKSQSQIKTSLEKTKRKHESGGALAREVARCEQSSGCATHGLCTAKDGKCVAAFDKDCAASTRCASNGECKVKNDRCGDGPDCDNWTCRSFGECTAKDGICVAGSDADCKASGGCSEAGKCVLVSTKRVRCGVVLDEDCEASEVCARHGACAAEAGECVPKSDAHCEASSDCKSKGKCGIVNGRCAPKLNAHCEAFSTCWGHGNCTAKGGQCIAASDSDCKASSDCTSRGECSAAGGVCVVRTDADCQPSWGCKTYGLCSHQNGKCVAASDAECAASVTCKTGRCVAKDGVCVHLGHP